MEGHDPLYRLVIIWINWFWWFFDNISTESQPSLFKLRKRCKRPIGVNPSWLLTRGTRSINYKKTFTRNTGLFASLINVLPQKKTVFIFRCTLIGFILRGVTIFIFNIVIYLNRHVPIIAYFKCKGKCYRVSDEYVRLLPNDPVMK